MNEKARVLLLINGRVQGVFFRLKTREEAYKLGLTGWVKNNGNGTVEALAEGDKDKLEELINWCKKGPEHAQVDGVDIKWQDFIGEFKSFEIV
jgi:acylphosphatase